jgi:DUF2892 family protein
MDFIGTDRPQCPQKFSADRPPEHRFPGFGMSAEFAVHVSWHADCSGESGSSRAGLARRIAMTTERLVHIFAGSFVLASLLLAWAVNDVKLFDGPTWLWFTAFVGANLLQSGFSRWCLLESILRKLGVESSGTATVVRT